ncbi:META domain-containing protein [Nocardioides lianchengensis]|uniref:Heat shock protein HslJ n=1 Tax=Nocardioides lianchengensis TaxID=1045774 RepID=A0A1G6XA89_9ACTN|nr:META domain-containing protein [Nocardioides lianchengensis]NYG09040.1 heat shock protein HslJ [Nocardioides lianchengensis]SDD75018.1 Heat shock protein HslJ [Nocardioides lianchengensis]
MRTLPVASLPLVLLLGCGSEADSATEPTPVTADGLEGSAYVSTGVEGRDLAAGTRVRLAFEDDTMSVSAGCNTMFGPYEVAGETLAWTGAPASTVMGCLTEEAAQDEWLTAWLTDGVTVSREGGDLRLAGDDVTITLAPADVADLDDVLGTSWTVVGTLTDGQLTPVPDGVRRPRLSVRADGLASLDTGCNNGRTTVRVADGTITFGHAAITRAACPEPAAGLERDVLAVLDGRSDEVTFDGRVLVVTKGDRGLVVEVG